MLGSSGNFKNMLTPEERSVIEEEDQYCFDELFYRDLESWFSSDIACCDNCYDDFLENWPHAYAADGIGQSMFFLVLFLTALNLSGLTQ